MSQNDTATNNSVGTSTFDNNCSAIVDYTVLYVLMAMLIMLSIATVGYNAFYLKLLCWHERTERWVKVFLVNIAICGMLYGLCQFFSAIYNVKVLSSPSQDFSEAQYCRWSMYSKMFISSMHMSLIALMAIVLSINVCAKGERLNGRILVASLLVVAWLENAIVWTAFIKWSSITSKSNCFCTFILSASYFTLCLKYVSELVLLLLAVIVFLYVYRSSRRKVLDVNIRDDNHNCLHQRMSLWHTATYTKIILPWAIVHTLILVLILCLSMASSLLYQTNEWKMRRIYLIISILFIRLMDGTLQPLILINSSHSLKSKVRKLRAPIRKLFFANVRCNEEPSSKEDSCWIIAQHQTPENHQAMTSKIWDQVQKRDQIVKEKKKEDIKKLP
ncbi:unnamed protein product [Soboliphyme baturini]|uniref:G_PROTEIN_RECEP_F1_2 domain-containing protein n=1 Tax=Soboliphyme baturini TaxID=241478 RepID=A0A183J5Z7_9BILA|nr:unnamed protein product [Soboliphyme baturini]